MENTNISAFISYRTTDGMNTPQNLQNHLRRADIDSYYDEENMSNDEELLAHLTKEIIKRDNFIILLTEDSVKYLLSWLNYQNEERINPQLRNIFFGELKAAVDSFRNIIPVFYKSDKGRSYLSDLADKLFRSFGRDAAPACVIREKDDTDRAFFQKIQSRLGRAREIEHTDLSKIYWVGTRESDMPVRQTKGFSGFEGGIFLFGEKNTEDRIIMCDQDGDSEDRVDHNDASDLSQDKFYEEAIKKIISDSKGEEDVRFMFYNPTTAHRLSFTDDERKHFLCLNDKKLLSRVNNKSELREMIRESVPLLPIVERTRMDCDYSDLHHLFTEGYFTDNGQYPYEVPPIRYDRNLRFIVQAPVSSGGSGTFILDSKNADYLLSSLDKKSKYLVSVYHSRNISVNMHAVIYDNRVVCLPGSIQIIREVPTENKLLYKGADFFAYKTIPLYLREEFRRQVMIVAEILRNNGYRGVCGIDAIIHDKRVNILEVNGRFQASTELLNRSLLANGQKTVQEMNLDAFSGVCPSDNFEPFNSQSTVPYSNYNYSYEGHTDHDSWIYKCAEEYKNERYPGLNIQADGYTPDRRKYRAQAYLYRVSFNHNIASINEDGQVLVHENICEPEKRLVRKIRSREKLAIKISLMIQGIKIAPEIQSRLREATNNAVDLQIGSKASLMIINAPTNIKYVEFSPFTLVPSEKYPDKYSIKYYFDLLIDNVGVFSADANQNLRYKEHLFSEIAYLSTDRLRVHITNVCRYKKINKDGTCSECKFCNIKPNFGEKKITPEDIEYVVDKYIQDKHSIESSGKYIPGETVTLRHFLIGGQSPEEGSNEIVDVSRVLGKYRGFPIYAMTLPLKDKTVEELVANGVLEYAYNIEIFNEECRKRYMPGKSRISVDTYMERLVRTRQILNRPTHHRARTAVRSMVIVGLEPYEDMIQGIWNLIQNDIEPMLSVFRPLPDTELENLNAPSIKMVYDLFNTVSHMLADYHAEHPESVPFLGPSCPCCQNNTVSLPWNIQKTNVVKSVWKIDDQQQNFGGKYEQ